MSTRRLAAILAADVVGYSRLMGVDEEGTLERLKAHRRELIDPKIAEHRGRIVKTTGDGMLVEFASAVDATRCAVELQRDMAERGSGVPLDKRIEIRIGVHVGDIIIDGDDIFGDGVNIAARLEGVAEPGGITISGSVHEQVRDRLPYTFDDGGAQSLKNIARPVQVWRWSPDDSTPSSITPTPSADVPLALPDKPSIAVLPFQNMSGDPDQEYFADGIVEDIITALSRFKSLFVIARNSSFTYKGRAVDIKRVARELGVRYVLEGSVRKAGSRVRITGQLINAATGAHLWADRFDGELDDIFSLQDRITESIVAAIQPSLQRAEIERTSAKPTENLDAYDLYLRAIEQFHARTKAGSKAAVELLGRAIGIDPAYSIAKGLLAHIYMIRNTLRWSEPGEIEMAINLAREVINSSDDPGALRTAGHALSDLAHEYDHAQLALERAARLNPNSAEVLTSTGWVSLHRGDANTAIDAFQRAMRISPLDPEIGFMAWGLGLGYLMTNRNAEALLFARRSIQEIPNWGALYRWMAFALVRLGRHEEARAAVKWSLDLDPGFRISTRTTPFRDQTFNDEYTAALKACGAPE